MKSFAEKTKRPKPSRPRAGLPSHSGSLMADRQNAAVRQILHGPRLQPKLKVGEPDDIYEREADGVGDGVKEPAKPVITHETNTPAPDGTDDTRTEVGVGEKVTFRGIKGKWSATKGLPKTLEEGAEFIWTAPNRAADVTIKLQVRNKEATVLMKVIEPVKITADKNSSMTFEVGLAAAGMELTFNYHPKKVSFGNVKAKEVSGNAELYTDTSDNSA